MKILTSIFFIIALNLSFFSQTDSVEVENKGANHYLNIHFLGVEYVYDYPIYRDKLSVGGGIGIGGIVSFAIVQDGTVAEICRVKVFLKYEIDKYFNVYVGVKTAPTYFSNADAIGYAIGPFLGFFIGNKFGLGIELSLISAKGITPAITLSIPIIGIRLNKNK